VSSAYNTNGFEFVTTAAGTVNFGAGNVTFAVGDNVIYDGTVWVKIPIGSSAGTVNSLLTVSDSGTGDIPTSTFNGSSPITISYNSIGASPTAGSVSLTTVGTIGTGTWNGSVVGSTYGGTGVNNAGRTLTISGANRTLDQDVSSASSPTFTGTNFSGTAASLTVGNATAAVSATSAGKSTNVAGGVANQIPYQTGADATAFITAASGTNTYLRWDGSAFTWSTVALATSATNVAGGAANQIVVQTGAGATGFVVAPTTTNTYLRWTGSAFAFSAVTGATGGTVTSVSGTGTVSGISLSGTVTSSGNLTLGGTLSLISPPAIGSTTPNTGAFTILTVNSASTSAVTLSPTGSGTVTVNPTTAGTINNMSIGATTRAAGNFTSLDSNSRYTNSFQSTTADAGGSIYLSNATNNRIDFAAGANAAPTFTTRSTGTKIVLWPAIAVASADYAIGIEGNTQWFSVPTSTQQFKWYAGTTNISTLSGAGALSAVTFTSTQATGTAPFTVTSTTNVANLNASSINGATFASPGAIGSTTASTGAFTTLSASSTVSGTGFSTYLASPPAIGGTAAAAGTFTTMNATTVQIGGKQAVNGPAFRAFVAVAQTIPGTGVQTKVTFGTETFDTNTNFATSRFTPTVEGYYQLNATVRIGGTSGTGEYMITIWRNGSEYARGTNTSGTEAGVSFYSMQVSDIVYANGSSDFFEIYIQQASGAGRDTTAGTNISYFSGCMIRGA
jgi:hypothetical protein